MVVCPSVKKPMPLKIMLAQKAKEFLILSFFGTAGLCFPAECFTNSFNFFFENLTKHTAAPIIFPQLFKSVAAMRIQSGIQIC